MSRGRRRATLVIDSTVREQLLAIARSRSLPHSVVRRAHSVLASAEGETDVTLAERFGVNRMTHRALASTL